MGFSLTAATAIIGVSILISVDIIIGTTVPVIIDTHNSYKNMKNRSIDQVQTDINITSIIATPNGTDHHDLTFTVKNVGSTTLETPKFDIIVDGKIEEFDCSYAHLYPEDEVTFIVRYLYGRSTTKRLKVVTNNGIEKYLTYYIS